MSDSTESEIIGRAVRGDADALRAILEGNIEALHGRISPIIPAQHRGVLDADDILQVTYMEAFLSIAGFHNTGDGAFLGWLTRIAKNNIKDGIRGLEADKRPPADRRIVPNSDESYARLLASVPETKPSPSGKVREKERRSLIDDALGKLPPDYEQVLRLFYLEGLNAPEVGEKIRRSPAAVHMLKGRGLRHLTKLLHESQFFDKST